MRIGILLPHVFAQQHLLKSVIFAPVDLAVGLADSLSKEHEVFLFTPGLIYTQARNINVDLSLIESELEREGCSLPELIRGNPMAFASLARSVQAELTAMAFEYANSGRLDVLHIFMCESEVPLYFSNLVNVPVVFTHHDPYNFYRRYRANFPKLKNLNYVSITQAQRKTAPKDLNFIANVYNGIDLDRFKFGDGMGGYFCNLGRIVRNKGNHIAIDVCKKLGVNFKFAGKYYTGEQNEGEDYWSKHIKPNVDDNQIEYVGFINTDKQRSEFLGNARAMLFPIEWEEPFGLVVIEAMACGTPVIAFDKGAMKELIDDGKTGFIVKNQKQMEEAVREVDSIDRRVCRKRVKSHFTLQKMVAGYLDVYNRVVGN